MSPNAIQKDTRNYNEKGCQEYVAITKPALRRKPDEYKPTATSA